MATKMEHAAARGGVGPQRPLIVVPAWNEVDTIACTIREIKTELPGLDILVVDDGSTDATARRAREAGASVAQLPFNLGVGGAMRTGYAYAARNGYDAVVQIDADGQHRPQDAPAMIAKLTEADLVIGNRFSGPGDYHVSGPRKWAMTFLAWAISTLAQRELRDTTSGLRAVGPRLLPYYAKWYPAGYLDNIEGLVMALRSGYTVSECPVVMRPRQGGVPSQSSLKLTLHLCRAVFVVALSMIRRWPKELPPSVPHPRSES